MNILSIFCSSSKSTFFTVQGGSRLRAYSNNAVISSNGDGILSLDGMLCLHQYTLRYPHSVRKNRLILGRISFAFLELPLKMYFEPMWVEAFGY